MSTEDAYADPREDLGKLVWATWKETDVPLPVDIRWESLPPSYKHVFATIGKALYDAGFEAGADSVRVVGSDDTRIPR